MTNIEHVCIMHYAILMRIDVFVSSVHTHQYDMVLVI